MVESHNCDQTANFFSFSGGGNSSQVIYKIPRLSATYTGTRYRQVCKLVHTFWVNDQLDAQLRYMKRLLLQSSTCFEQLCAHHQEVKLY